MLVNRRAQRVRCNEGLGSGASAFSDGARLPALMKASENDDTVGEGEIEQCVRESGKKYPANAAIHHGAGEGMLADKSHYQVER